MQGSDVSPSLSYLSLALSPGPSSHLRKSLSLSLTSSNRISTLCRTQQQAAQIAQLQTQLQQAQAALQEWVGTFEEEQRGGIFSGVVGQIHPLTVLNELRRLVFVSATE